MSFDRHRGRDMPPINAGHPDRRIPELDQALRELSPLDQLGVRHLGDAYGAIQAQLSQSPYGQRWFVGQVIHATPGLNFYKVQLGSGYGTVGACALEQGGLSALGPRTVCMYPAGTAVLVYKPYGVAGAFIAGAIPLPAIVDNGGPCPDWLTQGGSSGYKREPAHQQAIVGMFQGGGVQDYSAGRPVDQTQFDYGISGTTGISFNVNDSEAWLRINEMCGVYLSTVDSYAKLSGIQLDVSSAIHERSARCDEGESRLFFGVATFPWEALGLHTHGSSFLSEYPADAVQYELPQATLEPVDVKVQPIYRYQEWNGYFGVHRVLMLPGQAASVRLYDDAVTDTGLFRETISADGAYSLVTAKSYYIGKRCKVMVPREILPPEHGAGDDARLNNYRFANAFGGAEAHVVAEPELAATDTSAFRVAAVIDLIVHQFNWKGLHVFFYHHLDFDYADETDDSSPFSRTQEILDFASLASNHSLPDPTAVPLNIDSRYGDVAYYERESFFKLLDDGSVVLGCGFGATLIFTQGRIRLEAPNDIEIVAGRRIEMLGTQGILRFRDSVDITSAQKDVRIKAENNVQVLAGNSGIGTLLLESKGIGSSQQFTDFVGEDVTGGGIVLKAGVGVIATISDSLYMRTTGEDGITLDAAQGFSAVSIYGNEVNVFAQEGLAVWLPDVAGEDPGSFSRAHVFSDIVMLDSCAMVNGNLIVNGNLAIGGDAGASGNISAAGRLADSEGGMVQIADAGLSGTITGFTDQLEACSTALRDAGLDVFDAVLTIWYAEDMPGNSVVILDLGFSYRDVPSDLQYGTAQFKFAETRWQQMSRLGAATGGVAWVEPPVDYQTLTLYPWPGKNKWLDDATVFLQLEAHELFDVIGGGGEDLGALYEQPDLGDWSLTTMAAGFKVVF